MKPEFYNSNKCNFKQVQCIQDKFRQLGDVDAVSYEEFLAFVASSNPPLCQTTNATQRSPGPKVNDSLSLHYYIFNITS